MLVFERLKDFFFIVSNWSFGIFIYLKLLSLNVGLYILNIGILNWVEFELKLKWIDIIFDILNVSIDWIVFW